MFRLMVENESCLPVCFRKGWSDVPLGLVDLVSDGSRATRTPY